MMLFDEGLPEHRKPIMPLTIADFSERSDGEARIVDWRVAEVLGFTRGFNIHNLIERNRRSLEHFGTLLHREGKSTGGRPGGEYFLNFNQTIFIIIKSEAPNALPVQIHVVTIYGLWATGKLHPVDAATGTAIAVATAQTFQESPLVMGMLQGLLDQILSGQGDLKRVALEIQKDLAGIVNRKDAPLANQDIYNRVIEDFYVGRCPCCMRPDRVIFEDGKRTILYALDHWTEHPRKNALYQMWPICNPCNNKFLKNPLLRAEKQKQFDVFQTHVAESIGGQLL